MSNQTELEEIGTVIPNRGLLSLHLIYKPQSGNRKCLQPPTTALTISLTLNTILIFCLLLTELKRDYSCP